MTPGHAIWEVEAELADLPAVAHRLREALAATKAPFCLWLCGDLGAGKTTLVAAVLRALGLPAEAPVTSPTYVYTCEYQIDGAWYAHLDLYRASRALSLEDLGLADARDYRGYFVEWPDKVPGHPLIAPTHVLEIDFGPGETTRRFRLSDAKAKRPGT